MTSGDQLLTKLSLPVTLPFNLDRLEFLLNDYLACLINGVVQNERSLAQDGSIGFGAYLAMRASSKDRDDVTWALGSHIGAVVWSTIFPLGIKNISLRKNVIAAAYSGYQAGASLNNFLGPSHRMKWHVTATAGAVASASAASVMLGLNSRQHENSLRLALTNMSGSALAPREREGAAAFNRASATTLGLISAMTDAPSISNLWNASHGMLTLYSGTGGPATIIDGVSVTGIRPFATNGFAQSAVLATSVLSGRQMGKLHLLEVYVPQNTAPLLDGSRGGSWWTLKCSVASAWESADPTKLFPSPEIESLISIVPSDVPMNGARVIAHTSTGKDSFEQLSPPGLALELPQEQAWARAKWSAMAGSKADEISQMANHFVRGLPNDKLWKFFDQILNSAS